MILFLSIYCIGCGTYLVNKTTFFPQAGIQVDPQRLNVPIEHTYIKTDDNIKISAFFIPRKDASRTIIFFHGNGGNASHRLGEALALWSLRANVLLMDYRGYGLSVGDPSEKKFAGIVLVSPLSSGKAFARVRGLSWLTPFIGDPFNSLEKIEKIQSRLLVIHGDKDRIVPIEMGNRLCQQAKVENNLVIIPGAGHNDIITTDPELFFNTINSFLDEVAP
jgi:pimeloyl-ACP methyl ester carboxylesterase